MGMQCKKCQVDLEVHNSYATDNNQIRRTKVCPLCKARYQTIEILVEDYNSMANFFNGFVSLIQKYSNADLDKNSTNTRSSNTTNSD
jgi:protein-arginine kinase activator protein McsA